MKNCEICGIEIKNAGSSNFYEKNNKTYLLCEDCIMDVIIYLGATPHQIKAHIYELFQARISAEKTKKRQNELAALLSELLCDASESLDS